MNAFSCIRKELWTVEQAYRYCRYCSKANEKGKRKELEIPQLEQ